MIMAALLRSPKDHQRACRGKSAKRVLQISHGCLFKTIVEAVPVYQPKLIPIMNNELLKNQRLRYTPSSPPPVLHRQAGILAHGGISLGPLHLGTKISNGIVNGKTYMVNDVQGATPAITSTARSDPCHFARCRGAILAICRPSDLTCALFKAEGLKS